MDMEGSCQVCSCFFFFQAEDGIRDYDVTGVQTCALPISSKGTLWMLVSTSGTSFGATEEPSGMTEVGPGMAALDWVVASGRVGARVGSDPPQAIAKTSSVAASAAHRLTGGDSNQDRRLNL